MPPRDGQYIDPDGRVTVFQTDEHGNVTETSGASGDVIIREYNERHQVLSLTEPDPDGIGPLTEQVTTYDYNAKGNVERIDYPDGTFETWEYNQTFSQVTKHIDAENRTTDYTLDNFGNVETMTQVVGSPGGNDDIVTSYEYTTTGVLGLVEEMTDPTNIVTKYEYNEHGWLETTTYDYQGAEEAIREVLYDAFGNTKQITEQVSATEERVTFYFYDALNRLLEVRYPDPDGAGTKYNDTYRFPTTKYTYTETGQILTMTLTSADDQDDPIAETSYSTTAIVTKYDYDGQGRLKETIEDYGVGHINQSTSYGYDKAGNQITVTDAAGRVTETIYDLMNRPILVRLPDPDGAGSQVAPQSVTTYDDLGRVLRSVDPLGSTTRYVYDALARVTDVIGALGAAQHTVYNDAGEVVESTDAEGNITSYEYDDLGRVETITLPKPDPDTDAPTIEYTYYDDGQVESTTDPRGFVTDYQYYRRGWLKQVILPDPDTSDSDTSRPTTKYTYNDLGEQLTVEEMVTGGGSPVWRTTSYEYDNLGRLDTVIQPEVSDGDGGTDTPTTENWYDVFGRLIKMTDPVAPDGDDEHSTQYEYDNLGRRTVVTLPEPEPSADRPQSSYTYTATGQIQTMTDPEDRVTTYQYDDLDRLIRLIAPDPTDGTGPDGSDPNTDDPDTDTPFTTYQYDIAGNVISTADALEHTTEYEYDHLYRLVKQTRIDAVDVGDDEVTVFGYDLVGNRTSLGSIVWGYNGLNRVINESFAANKNRTFAYDEAGNLIQKIDRNNRKTSYEYDALNRLVSENWFDGSYPPEIMRTIAYSYDLLSRLTGVTDHDTEDTPMSADYTFSYDVGDRATQIEIDPVGISDNVFLIQDHDLTGRRVQLQVDIGSTPTHDFKNDYEYDKLGRMTQVTQQANATGTYNAVAEKLVEFQYNLAGQFDTLSRYKDTSGGSGNRVAVTAYGYDGTGRLNDFTHDLGTAGTPEIDYDLAYDRANRLASLTNSAHSGENVTAYAYDGRGELTDVNYASITDETYDYDAGGNREGGSDPFAYTYDAEGNLTKKEIDEDNYTQYYYDHHNRMTRARFVVSGSIVKDVRYTYDPFDRLVKRSTDTTSSFNHNDAAVEYFVSDGPDIALKWVDPDGTGSTAPALDRRYLNGPAIDQILAEEDDATDTPSWMIQDRQGSVTDVVDNTGSVIDHIFYDGYGNVLDETAPSTKHSYGYAGYFRDEATGFSGTWTRWYNPFTGRWTSEDPIGFAAGDSNLFRYVGNGPTNAVDPTGLANWADYAMDIVALELLGIWMSRVVGFGPIPNAPFWFTQLFADVAFTQIVKRTTVVSKLVQSKLDLELSIGLRKPVGTYDIDRQTTFTWTRVVPGAILFVSTLKWKGTAKVTCDEDGKKHAEVELTFTIFDHINALSFKRLYERGYFDSDATWKEWLTGLGEGIADIMEKLKLAEPMPITFTFSESKSI